MAVIVALAAVGVTSPLLASPSSPSSANRPPVSAFLAEAETPRAVPIGICAAALLSLAWLWRRNVIRPGSLDRGGPLNLDGPPVPVWLCAAAMMFVFPALGAALTAALPPSILGPKDSIQQHGVVGIVAYAIAIACGGVLAWLLASRIKPPTGLRLSWKDLPVGVGALVVTMPIVLMVGIISTEATALITRAKPDLVAHSTLQQIIDESSNPWIYAVIFTAVVGAPIVEELTYRVFLQSAMVRALASRWAGVLITSVLFALVHRLGGAPVPWHAIPVLVALGIACGVAYERTRRLGVPIIMHAGFNAYNVALALLLHPAAK